MTAVYDVAKYRDMVVGFDYEIRLYMDASFSYGIPFILEFGVYL